MTGLLGAIAAWGLPAEARRQRDTRVLEPRPGWGAVLDVVEHERLTGLLVAAADSGAIVAGRAWRDELLDRHERALAHDLRLEQLLTRVSARLLEAGIPMRVLKGPALAHLDYPDPALRSFGDIDLLVPGEHYDRAVAVFESAGGHTRYPEPRTGFTARFGKGVCIETTDGLEVDLHRSFVAGPFGISLPTAELFGDASGFEVGGTRLLALAPTPRFLHACYHAALGGRRPRFSALRDVAQLAWSDTFDAETAVSTAARWRALIVVQHAWNLVGDHLDVVPPPALARHLNHRTTGFERRALAAYTSERRSYGSQAAAGVLAIPRTSDRIAYVRALVWPDRGYLASRERRYRTRVRRAIRLARSTGTGHS